MIRGTTAQFKFKLPYSKDELEWITIKFWQSGNPNPTLPITKTKSNCSEPNDKEICVSLLASETIKFSDKYKVKVQLKAQPFGGTVFGSKQQLVTVYPMIDETMGGNTAIEDLPTEGDWIIFDGGSIID